METRHAGRLAASLLALALIGCGETPSTDPSLPAPADPVAPAGESMEELLTSSQRELDQLKVAEEADARIALSRGPRRTIVEIAQATPELSILVQAVVKADLVEALSAPGARTVFAPTNDAFIALLGQLGLGSLDDIPDDVLRTVLLSHVFPGFNVPTVLFRPIDFLDYRLETLGGLKLDVSRAPHERSFQVNDIDIVVENVRASNGIVHVISQVLPVPDARPTIVEAALELASQGQFTALVAAVVKTGLVDALNDPHDRLTVFAPTDEAFARLGFTAQSIEALTNPADIDGLRDVLLDHVVGHEFDKGELRTFRFLRTLGGLFLRLDRGPTSVNGIPIVAGDAVRARNGVVHVIDGVLLP
jgi:transforming growth factor-beta-induced protein